MPMADPVYPNHSPERELPEHATPSAIGHIPVAPASPRLNSAAESVGSTLGTAVSSVRGIPDKLQDAKARFTVIRGRKTQDVRHAAEETVNRIRDAGAEIKEQARERLQQAGCRADHLAHEYPLHVIAGAAALAMLLGIGLRVWRDHAS